MLKTIKNKWDAEAVVVVSLLATT